MPYCAGTFFQEFNYKCFCKITTMYDSKFVCEHGLKWRNERLDTSLLNTDRGQCEHLMSELEVSMQHCNRSFSSLYSSQDIQLLDKTLNVILQTFMIQLEGGDKLRAMKRLEVPPMDKTLVTAKSLTCEIELLAVNQQVY